MQHPMCPVPGCGTRHKTPKKRFECIAKGQREQATGKQEQGMGRYSDEANATENETIIGGRVWNQDRVNAIQLWGTATLEAEQRRALMIEMAARTYREDVLVVPDEMPVPKVFASKYAQAYDDANRVYREAQARAAVAARDAGMRGVDMPAAQRLLSQDMTGSGRVSDERGMMPVRASTRASIMFQDLPPKEQSAYMQGLASEPEPRHPDQEERQAYEAGQALRTTQNRFGSEEIPRRGQAHVLVPYNGVPVERSLSDIRPAGEGIWEGDTIPDDHPDLIRTGHDGRGERTVQFERRDLVGWEPTGFLPEPDHEPVPNRMFRTPASGQTTWPSNGHRFAGKPD